MKKKLPDEINNILIDFGNHYIQATEGKKLDLKYYCNQLTEVIEKEKKIIELETVIDVKDYIEGMQGENENLVESFNSQIDELKSELAGLNRKQIGV